MATLYIVATPIGNLNDLSMNAIETLGSVDYILAEDTRRFQKLRSHIIQSFPDTEINGQIIRYDEHTEQRKTPHVIEMLDQGQDIALVSDAGMPLISDPGTTLVRAVWEFTPHHVTVIPGPSAVSTALAISGLPPIPHMFLGYFPRKGLHSIIKNSLKVSTIKRTTFVAFESPHRLLKTIQSFDDFGNENNEGISLVVLFELTKKHERRYAGTPTELVEVFASEQPKGECVVLWTIG